MNDRDELGYFRKGHAIKSPGRPPGPSRADVIAEYLAPHQVEVLQKLVELAKLGDPKSMGLFLERVAPLPKEERLKIPGLKDAETLGGKADAILAAVADGHITADTGDKLMGTLDKFSRVVVTADHEARLAAIESGRMALLPRVDPAPEAPGEDDDLT